MSDWAHEMAEGLLSQGQIERALRDVQRETVEKCCDEVCLRCSRGEVAERLAGTWVHRRSRGEVAERLAGGWVHAVTGGSVECKAKKIRDHFLKEEE